MTIEPDYRVASGMISKVIRFWETVRHLKAAQVFGRFRFLRPSINTIVTDCNIRQPSGQWNAPPKRQAFMLAPSRFKFLGVVHDIGSSDGWNNPEYDKLWLYDTEFGRPSGNFTNRGYGSAKGIDLFWKDSHNIKNLQYWLSYSYLDTERKYQDYPEAVMPSFATNHNASLVTKYWINDLRSQVGMTYSFASGRPYDNPNSIEFMNGRSKNYNNVSFNWSYLISQQKILFISL